MSAGSYTPAGMAGGAAGGGRVRLVEVLIGALCAGGRRLARVRSEIAGMDPAAGLRRLVLQAVDPELLEAVVGPDLVPAWVAPLRAQYVRFQRAYPADWVDVEKVWRQQRARWRGASGAAGSRAACLARGYPERADRGASAPGVRSRRVAGSGVAGVPSERSVLPSGAPLVHRPTPAGRAPAPAADEEPVVAGSLVEEVLDEPEDSPPVPAAYAPLALESFHESSLKEDSPPVPAAYAPGAAGAGSVQGVVPNPAQRGRSAAYERRRDDRASAVGDTVVPSSTLVLSGRPGELAERLVEAMQHSRARVESVRRVWIAADGVPGGWDLWALDPLVLERLRTPDRAPRR